MPLLEQNLIDYPTVCSNKFVNLQRFKKTFNLKSYVLVTFKLWCSKVAELCVCLLLWQACLKFQSFWFLKLCFFMNFALSMPKVFYFIWFQISFSIPSFILLLEASLDSFKFKRLLSFGIVWLFCLFLINIVRIFKLRVLFSFCFFLHLLLDFAGCFALLFFFYLFHCCRLLCGVLGCSFSKQFVSILPLFGILALVSLPVCLPPADILYFVVVFAALLLLFLIIVVSFCLSNFQQMKKTNFAQTYGAATPTPVSQPALNNIHIIQGVMLFCLFIHSVFFV